MKSADNSSVKSAQQSSVSSFAVNQSIEAKLNLKDLEKIMTAFMPEPDYKGEQVRLDCDEFSERLRSTLKKGCKNDYIELFEKIDITKEGTVDWDKFVEYMLLEFYEEDEKVKTTQVPQWKELRMISSPHKDLIQRIELLKCMNRYVTVSKEGMVVFWDLQMKLAKNSRLSVEAIKQKDLWVTDCVVMANINKLAVTFTSKEIVIYDLSSKPDFNCQYRIQGFKYTPICLNYWFNCDDMEHSILSVGDMGGEVTAIIFYSAQTTLFPRPHHQGGKEGQHADEITTCIKLKNIPREKTKKSKLRLVHHDIHDGWVRYVKYIEHLECFISCSTGKKHSIILSYIDKVKSSMRSVTLHYDNGVNCFDYHKRLNLIVTGGINNQVCLWNPYVVSKPVGVLSGHMAPVIQVAVNQRKTQAMTFSKDKVLRVWDIQQQLCLQRIAGIFPKGPEVQSRMYFDDNVNRLFVTFNYQLTALDMKVEIREQVLSHDQPISCVLYNPKHNQVLTSCIGGSVNVWMIDNGQKIKQFQDCHGQAEVATMALDQDRSRLLTGGSDGSVKIWDFNGHCHHNLICAGGQSADISQILMLKHSILVVGWSRLLTIFRKASLKEYHVDSSEWLGGCEHDDDILCADYYPPSLLVTASYDGEIVVWNANSESLVKKLRDRSRNFLTARESSSAATSSRDQQRPITTESQTSELEFSCVISRLIILKHRLQVGQQQNDGCDLISCGGTGWCRMWSITHNTLMYEFIAHPHAGNIIGTTDDENNFLVTGDSDGVVKIWSISNYLLNYDDIKVDPERMTSWQAHQDVITSMQICKKLDNLLLITASSDCSVTLWDFHGGKIGDFGQEKHWRLDLALESLRNKENGDNGGTQNENEEKDLMDEFESRCTTAASVEDTKSQDQQDVEDLDHRYNTWKKTVLGDTYKEERTKKRERKQPGTVPGFKRYLESVQTPYGVLNTSDLQQTMQIDKPDFVVHPHKYFGEKLFNSSTDDADENTQQQTTEDEKSIRDTRHLLKAAFDEKTFFPKELLEYETHMRAQHQHQLRLLNSKKPKLSTTSGILKSSITSQMFHQHQSTTGRSVISNQQSLVSSSPSNQQSSKINKTPQSISFLPTT